MDGIKPLTNLDRMINGIQTDPAPGGLDGWPMRSDNSQHLVAAAHKRATQTRRAGRSQHSAGSPTTPRQSASTLSLAKLYAQPDLRAQIEQLRARNHPRPPAAPPERPDIERMH